MLECGESAPGFTLPGWHEGEVREFALNELAETGPVLLGIYPFDFTPVCAAQMCQLSDMGWYQYKIGLTIVGLSRDSPYAHSEFAKTLDIEFPLLSDMDGEVCDRYGVLRPESGGIENVPQRSLFLIDSDRRIQYRWVAEHNTDEVDLDNHPVKDAIQEL